MIGKIALTTAALALALAVVAPTASLAADYCVGTTLICISANNYPATTAGFQSAATAVAGATGSNRVIVAPGVYQTASSLIVAPIDTLDIIGSGRGQTVFELTGGNNQTALQLDFADSISIVRDLSVKISNTNAQASTQTWGMDVQYGRIQNVDVTDQSTHSTKGIVLALGAAVIDSTVSVNSSGDTAVAATSGDASLSGLAINGASGGGGTGLDLGGSTYSVNHSEFRNLFSSITIDDGFLEVSDTLIELGAKPNAVAMYTGNSNPGSSSIAIASLARSTIVGSGSGQRGLRVLANDATDDATVAVYNTLIHLTGTSTVDLQCNNSNSGISTLETDFTAFNPSSVLYDPGCSTNDTNSFNATLQPAAFVNAAGGDYRLAWGSPYTDGGDESVGPASSSTDLNGRTRVTDGDADALPKLDVGAYEYQRIAPIASAAATQSSVAIGEATTFSGLANDSDGDGVTYSWSFDDGATAFGQAVGHTFATGGPHTATLTVTDASGLTGVASASVTVRSPIVSVAAKASKAYSRKNKRGFALVAKTGDPSIGLTIADATSLKLTLEIVGTGKRKSGKCVKGKGKPKCTLYTALKGTSTVAVSAGATKLTFGGKHGGKLLKPGVYRLTIAPVLGSTTGIPVQTQFKLK